MQPYVKIGARRIGKYGLWATFVGLMRNRLQSPPRNPGSSSFVTHNRAPTTCADTFPLPVNSAGDRTRAGNHYDARLPIGGAVQSNVTVGYQLDLFYSQRCAQSLAHPRANVLSSDSRKSNSDGSDFVTLDRSRAARFINRIAYGRGCAGDSHPQRIRRARGPFPQHALLAIENQRPRL